MFCAAKLRNILGITKFMKPELCEDGLNRVLSANIFKQKFGENLNIISARH